MENNTQPCSEHEGEQSRRLTEIRFEAVVKMYDFGIKKIPTGSFLNRRVENLPPQWFKIMERFTLEAIKHASAESLGLQLKSMLYQLEERIKEYENKK